MRTVPHRAPTKEALLIDFTREIAIHRTCERLRSAVDKREQAIQFNLMCTLIKERSARAVAAMERARGLSRRT